jgi:hypothetical protein
MQGNFMPLAIRLNVLNRFKDENGETHDCYDEDWGECLFQCLPRVGDTIYYPKDDYPHLTVTRVVHLCGKPGDAEVCFDDATLLNALLDDGESVFEPKTLVETERFVSEGKCFG